MPLDSIWYQIHSRKDSIYPHRTAQMAPNRASSTHWVLKKSLPALILQRIGHRAQLGLIKKARRIYETKCQNAPQPNYAKHMTQRAEPFKSRQPFNSTSSLAFPASRAHRHGRIILVLWKVSRQSTHRNAHFYPFFLYTIVRVWPSSDVRYVCLSIWKSLLRTLCPFLVAISSSGRKMREAQTRLREGRLKNGELDPEVEHVLNASQIFTQDNWSHPRSFSFSLRSLVRKFRLSDIVLFSRRACLRHLLRRPSAIFEYSIVNNAELAHRISFRGGQFGEQCLSSECQLKGCCSKLTTATWLFVLTKINFPMYACTYAENGNIIT